MGTLSLAESHSSQNEGSVHRRHPRPCLCWVCPLLRGVQCRGCRTPGEVDLRRVDRGADRDPHLPSLPTGCRCRCLRSGTCCILGDMANCLYPAFIGAGDACERLDLCKVREWTCDDCTAVMTRVANFMKEADTIAQGVGILQGECFCGAAGHTADCPDLVAGLAEPAMMVLSAVLMETTPELCQDIVGVC